MKSIHSIPFFIGRIIVCSITLFIIYISYGPPGYVELELINFLIYLVILPLVWIFGTIICCLLLSLPILLIHRIRNWLYNRPWIAFVGLVTGISIILVSPYFMDYLKQYENETEVIKEIPDYRLLITGWFLTAFFLLHFYPLHFLETVMNKLKHRENKNEWTEKV